MAVCPFLSGPMFDSTGVFVSMHEEDCIQSSCRLWDSNKGECSIKVSGVHVAHIHDGHWHQSKHECPDVPSGCGKDSSVQTPPLASSLVQEYMANEDMDGNGKVYGFDFKIEDDGNKPPMLKGLEDQPEWPNPSESMTWDEYKDSL